MASYLFMVNSRKSNFSFCMIFKMNNFSANQRIPSNEPGFQNFILNPYLPCSALY